MQVIGRAEQVYGTQGRAEAPLATREADLINLRIGSSSQGTQDAYMN